jgi:pyruvate dehydrogenase E1 component
VKDLSDEDIMYLNRGGHDPYKVYAAYARATGQFERPTVVLAMTVKGYGMGEAGEARTTTHSAEEARYRGSSRPSVTASGIPIDDRDLADGSPYRPDEQQSGDALHARAAQGAGRADPRAPARGPGAAGAGLDAFGAQTKGSGEREISTTMAFVRILTTLLAKDKHIGKRVVPIVPDEARTFGMEGMFRQLGIYSPKGQRYTPHDPTR